MVNPSLGLSCKKRPLATYCNSHAEYCAPRATVALGPLGYQVTPESPERQIKPLAATAACLTPLADEAPDFQNCTMAGAVQFQLVPASVEV